MRITKSVILLLLLLMPITSVYGVKPLDKPGSEEYGWYLSGDIMPVPPYGSADIIGSDTASKLLVNQQNGNTEVTITGVMKGLNPDSTYQVYLSKEYPLYPIWNIEGSWIIDFDFGSPYVHDMTITSQDVSGAVTGVGGYPSGGAYTHPWTVTGQVTGTSVSLTIVYGALAPNPGYTVWMIGTINPIDGSMSGTMTTSSSQSGTWTTTSGTATISGYRGTTWPGYFTSEIPYFTFTTDEFGSGSWHVNLRDEHFSGSGDYTLSVWINYMGKTILISQNFSVIVE